MARFDSTAVASPKRRTYTKTINKAGGEAYKQDAKQELAHILLTSFVTDQFYEGADSKLSNVGKLVQEVDPVFAAKAAIYARNEFGMRSITHALAAELAASVKGEKWTKRFYEKVVRRPDDITEILAYYLGSYGKPLPNSLKKGLGNAFGKFDGYQLGKYRGERKNLSLIDAVNLVRPRPTSKNAEALSALVNGDLRSEGTWEAKLSDAGKSEDKEAAKKQSWAELISERKIGYFALLRNLRNIEEQAPEVLSDACKLLVDESLIRKSLVLPFRYLSAFENVSERKTKTALNKAIDIAVNNVPELDGKTLVVVDHSGSMGWGFGWGYTRGVDHGNINSLQFKGDLFAAALYKKNDADVMVFGTSAGYISSLNPDDAVMSIATQIASTPPPGGHGTSFRSIFEKMRGKYDRVVVFSDMQAWVGYYTPEAQLNDYKRREGVDPHIYTIDLAGHGTTQFQKNRIYELAGFSEKIFDLMKLLEQDRNALINTIEGVEL